MQQTLYLSDYNHFITLFVHFLSLDRLTMLNNLQINQRLSRLYQKHLLISFRSAQYLNFKHLQTLYIRFDFDNLTFQIHNFYFWLLASESLVTLVTLNDLFLLLGFII